MENPIKIDDLGGFPIFLLTLYTPFRNVSFVSSSLSGSFTGSWGFINSSSFTGGPGEDALRLTPAKFNSEFTPEK